MPAFERAGSRPGQARLIHSHQCQELALSAGQAEFSHSIYWHTPEPGLGVGLVGNIENPPSGLRHSLVCRQTDPQVSWARLSYRTYLFVSELLRVELVRKLYPLVCASAGTQKSQCCRLPRRGFLRDSPTKPLNMTTNIMIPQRKSHRHVVPPWSTCGLTKEHMRTDSHVKTERISRCT